jgi:hypothetical protein
MSETGIMLEKYELTSLGVQILQKRGENTRDSQKAVVPAHRLIEELRPALSSVLVFCSRSSPSEEDRHA